MHFPFSRYLWDTGARIRNPNLKKHFLALKNTEYAEIEQLKTIQFNRALETLVYAFTHSQFYKRKFLNVDFDPKKDFCSLEDIKKIPFTTKDELIEHNNEIHSIYNERKVFPSETSGTTGQSLKFRKDENWDSFNRAARARGFSWYGVELWERNGYLWGYDFSIAEKIKTNILDTLQNRFRIFSYDEDEIIRFAEKLINAKYLCGYSSMIYEIAKRINNNPKIIKPLNLKVVCGTSEKIYESYQNQAIQAFGKRIIGEYGAAEAGIIAFECPYGSLHINMEGVLVEEYDGEIIVTNLIARSFPIIRYKLGDYIKLKDQSYQCPCGMKHRVIESVLGRVGKLIRGKVSSYPSLTFYYIFKNLATSHNLELNYQAEQHSAGEIILRIQQQLSAAQKSLLEKELLKYFGNDLTWTVYQDQKIHKIKGKYIDFVSTID